MDDVVNMTFDLFCDLDANDKQLDFPIVYGSARNGYAIKKLDEESDNISISGITYKYTEKAPAGIFSKKKAFILQSCVNLFKRNK